MKIVSTAQMKELDRKTIEEYKIPGEILMERAGTAVALATMELITKKNLVPRALLFAGKGNNGGDAFVAARLLAANGIEAVTVLLYPDTAVKGDAKRNLDKLKENGHMLITATTGDELASLEDVVDESGIIVDGILGTGIKGAVTGITAAAITLIEQSGKPVVAIDIPSGLKGDTGKCEGVCISADSTVTMGLPKTGLVKYPGLEYTGELRVVDIGIPDELIEEVTASVELVTEEDIRPLIPARKRLSHKGDYGHLLIVAGSPGMTGAAALCGMAAVRAGAGLVTVGVPASLNPILEVKLTEVMTLPLPETEAHSLSHQALPVLEQVLERFDALLIGPGLSRHDDTTRLVCELLPKLTIPAVLDADGLNALQGKTGILEQVNAPLIVTPHPGEMARLCGITTAEVQRDRWKVARVFAQSYNITMVLKGAGTVIAAPDGTVAVNTTGNPGMASGGTGDVLSGLIASFLGQGMAPFDATQAGVYIHGRAGDLAADERGMAGLIASDLVEHVSTVMKQLE